MIRNRQRKCRPIIVKPTSAIDKAKIFRLSKNLKTYDATAKLSHPFNSSVNDDSQAKRHVYVTDHLPGAFLIKKRSRMPKFKAAGQAERKTFWKLVPTIYM